MSGILAGQIAGKFVHGQAEFASSQSWIVPAEVTAVSVVCVAAPTPAGGSTSHAILRRGGVTLLSSATAIAGSVGGGNGGAGGAGATYARANPQPGEGFRWDFVYFGGGGGAAGGYTGDGGAGATARIDSGAANGSAGSGGGGGGGPGDAVQIDGPGSFFYITSRNVGGGVGLRGAGSSGAGGTSSAGGAGSLNTIGQPTPGGASPGASSTSISLPGNFPDTAKQAASVGGKGGDLRYLNSIAVTPGESLTLTVPTGAGIRIMWGYGRSYPSNAANK